MEQYSKFLHKDDQGCEGLLFKKVQKQAISIKHIRICAELPGSDTLLRLSSALVLALPSQRTGKGSGAETSQ